MNILPYTTSDVLSMENTGKEVDEDVSTESTKEEINEELLTESTKEEINEVIPTESTMEEINEEMPTVSTKEEINEEVPTESTKEEMNGHRLQLFRSLSEEICLDRFHDNDTHPFPKDPHELYVEFQKEEIKSKIDKLKKKKILHLVSLGIIYNLYPG